MKLISRRVSHEYRCDRCGLGSARSEYLYGRPAGWLALDGRLCGRLGFDRPLMRAPIDPALAPRLALDVDGNLDLCPPCGALVLEVLRPGIAPLTLPEDPTR